jgi:predicted acetyltransferase
MFFLAAASFTDFIGPDSATAGRTLMPADGAVVVRDGDAVVGWRSIWTCG